MDDMLNRIGDWFIDTYIELLYGIHGANMWEEADHADEIIWRLHQLGDDYIKGYVPEKYWMTESQQARMAKINFG